MRPLVSYVLPAAVKSAARTAPARILLVPIPEVDRQPNCKSGKALAADSIKKTVSNHGTLQKIDCFSSLRYPVEYYGSNLVSKVLAVQHVSLRVFSSSISYLT